MHYMNKSASESRRERTLRAITRGARELTEDHGLDGFTMDQLAEQVGVSRRTLFNYVPGKLDAVLGPEKPIDPAIVEVFLAGGPTGDLLVDVKEVVRASLEADVPDPAELAAVRRLLRRDTRLMVAVHERFVEKSRQLSDAIATREGRAVDPLDLRLIGTLIIGLCDTALDESLAQPTRTVAECFDHAFDAMSALFASHAA
jgi:AcrR family transcriptional regulator